MLLSLGRPRFLVSLKPPPACHHWAATSKGSSLVLAKPFLLPVPQFPFSSSCFCPSSPSCS